MESASAWEWPEKIPPLVEGAPQVWRLDARGELGEWLAAAGRGLLSTEELRRAEAIRVDLARREFVAGRVLVRRLLGAALACDPKVVEFGFGANGKPHVTPACGVEFNLSHSGGMVVAAISRGAAVGIDVEWIDPSFAKGEELMAIAHANFHPEELVSIRHATSDEDRLLAFYVAWARKEAISKAAGRGIAAGIEFAEDAAAEHSRAVPSLAGQGDAAQTRYSVKSLWVAKNFAAAVAVNGGRVAVELYDTARLFRNLGSSQLR